MAIKKYLNEAGLRTLVNQINNKFATKAEVASIYQVKGSSKFAELPALAEVSPGWVYNVTDEFVTTADFVEGAGIKITAGTNIVAVNNGTADAKEMKWDVLAATVQTDGFQLKNLTASANIYNVAEAKEEEISTIESAISKLAANSNAYADTEISETEIESMFS